MNELPAAYVHADVPAEVNSVAGLYVLEGFQRVSVLRCAGYVFEREGKAVSWWRVAPDIEAVQGIDDMNQAGAVHAFRSPSAPAVASA